MTVYLVGAGPGDPGLLTLRAAEVLARADVVVFDRLSQGAVLELAPPHAEHINVGKFPGNPRLTQDEINQLLVDRARRGGTIVRLKGGDPMLFARGGEEAACLHNAGINFEIVPGISSAFAAPAYAGIPVTLRHSSTSVTIITGHEAPDSSAVNWEAAAKLGGTLVILMGVARWPDIAQRLLTAGLPADTPTAAISWGTRPNQQIHRATLATLPAAELVAPSVIVVGEVARHHAPWFERLALLGLKVAVTRPVEQARGLRDLLRSHGAEAVAIPLLEITTAGDGSGGSAELREAVQRLKDGLYDWVVFTSANGVRKFMELISDARDFAGAKVAAIGPATAAALAEFRLVADLVPPEYVAESLLEEFPSATGEAARILIPRAEKARDVLPEGLTEQGWDVEVVSAYRSVGVELTQAERDELANCDVLTFLSPSAVEQFVKECPELAQTLASGESSSLSSISVPPESSVPMIACVGPITAQAARDLGLPVAVVAETYTSEGLVDALIEHVSSQSVS